MRSFSKFVALKLMRSKTNNGFLSFISWISMFGLIVGVASLIVVTSVLNGFEVTLTNKILGIVPHATIESSEPIADWQRLGEEVVAAEKNVISYAPFVKVRGMTSINSNVHGTIINGIDTSYHNDVSVLADLMIDGQLSSLTSGSNNIILGKKLVDDNNLQIGDSVALFVSKPSTSVAGMKPIVKNYTLSGIFSATTKVEEWMSYVAMDDASTLNEQNLGVRGIRFKLQDVMKSDYSHQNIQKIIAKLDSNPYSYYHWKLSHASLYKTISMQKNVASLLLFLIILVAAFNIVSTLIMLITEKKSEIAILKTYGASVNTIKKIFVIQGAVIGLFGISIGLILGLAISFVLDDVTQWIDSVFQFNLFDKYYIKSLVIDIRWFEVLSILSMTFLVTIISTVYPAHIASKIKPAQTLKSQ